MLLKLQSTQRLQVVALEFNSLLHGVDRACKFILAGWTFKTCLTLFYIIICRLIIKKDSLKLMAEIRILITTLLSDTTGTASPRRPVSVCVCKVCCLLGGFWPLVSPLTNICTTVFARLYTSLFSIACLKMYSAFVLLNVLIMECKHLD